VDLGDTSVLPGVRAKREKECSSTIFSSSI
jgi:hypothetical protein